MSKWTLQSEKIIQKNKDTGETEEILVSKDFQVDEVGNIYQLGGGIIEKACQKCETPFSYKEVTRELKQQIPIYKCKECKFESSSGDDAFMHNQDKNHKIERKTEEKIVGYEKILEGVISRITKTEDDVIILCDECNGQS